MGPCVRRDDSLKMSRETNKVRVRNRARALSSVRLRRVVGLLAVEDALECIEVPLCRGWTVEHAAPVAIPHGLLDHGVRELFQRLPGPHRVDLPLCRALGV